MRVKTAELIGPALDHAVGKALGWVDYPDDSVEHGSIWHLDADGAPFGRTMHKLAWTPSTDWLQGVPIIEREFHAFDHIQSDRVCAIIKRKDMKNGGWNYGYGPTMLIAAMRCYVESRLGIEVEIPDELL